MEKISITDCRRSIDRMRGTWQIMNEIKLSTRKDRKAPELVFVEDHECFYDAIRNVIHIGWLLIYYYLDPQTEEEFISGVEYIIGHEQQHYLSTASKPFAWAIVSGYEYVIEYISGRLESRPKKFRKESDYDEYIDHTLPSVYGLYISKGMLLNITHGIVNSLEDGRIERIASKERPFALQKRAFRGKIWLARENYRPEPAEVENCKAKMLPVITDEILTLATSQVYSKGFAKEYDGTETKAVVDSVMPDIAKAIMGKDTRIMATHAINVSKILAPYIYETCVAASADEEIRRQMEKMLADLIKSMVDKLPDNMNLSENDEASDDGDPRSTFPESDLTVVLDDETYDKLEEKLKNSSEKGSGINIKREHPKVPEPSHDEHDDPAQTTVENGDELNGRSNGSGTDGAGSEKENDAGSESTEGKDAANREEKDSSSGSAGNDSASDSAGSGASGNDGEGDSQSTGSDSSSGSNGNDSSSSSAGRRASVSKGEGDSQSADNSSSSGSAGNGVSGSEEGDDQSADSGSPSGDCTANDTFKGEAGSPCNEDDEAGPDSKTSGVDAQESGSEALNESSGFNSGAAPNGQIIPAASSKDASLKNSSVNEEAIRKASEEAAKTAAVIAESELSRINERTAAESKHAVKEVPDSDKPLTITDVKDLMKGEGFEEVKRAYKLKDNLPPVVAARGRTMKRANDRYFKSLSTPNVRYLDSGIVDPSRIFALGIGDTDIFKKQGKDKKFNGCAYILIDNSGSMAGNKRSEACKAAAVIEEGFRGIMPFKICAFDYWGGVVHEVIKGWDESTQKNACWNFCLHGRQGCGNADAFDIAIAARELSTRPEAKKMLVVLSDGMPTEASEGQTKSEIDKARKAGIKVCGIYFEEGDIGRDAAGFKAMYQRDYICCELSQLDKELSKIFKSFSRS